MDSDIRGKIPVRAVTIEETFSLVIRQGEDIGRRIEELEKGFSHLDGEEKRVQNLRTGIDGLKAILRTLIEEIKQIERDHTESEQERLHRLAVF